ncbi:MAG: DegQ family serine endoprotease [Burkholderiales bacterium]|nr:MAG: DegQ family serine endoprotease [Burkholderiales bacterium]
MNMTKRILLPLIAGLATLLLPLGAGAASARGLPDFADLVERSGPAVVNIRTVERVRSVQQLPFPGAPQLDENDPFYEFFRRFFPPRPDTPPRGGGGQEVPRGVGSGFVISADGYVLTNHHVVDGADEIYVTMTDEREFQAKLVGSDRRTDVALVKIEASSLPTLPIGDPAQLRVGEWVVAIGSPFGLENTVTAGIVSAKGRETGDYLPFIQTDVAVNPGNSGGPLLNMDGEVVGINSQIYSRTGGFMGISFAFPIDEVMRVADQLRTSGRVIRGRIGVGIAEVTKDVAEPLGLPRALGALVRSVEAGGPADRAGVQVGDIILNFDGRAIDKVSDLPRIVGGTRPGSKAPVTVWRHGQKRDLTITVGEMQPERTARAGAPGAPVPEPTAANLFGLAVAELSPEQREQLRVRGGALVESVNPDSTAARAGIRPGDVILGVDNIEVASARQFDQIAARLDRDRTHVLLVQRGENATFVPIRPAS